MAHHLKPGMLHKAANVGDGAFRRLAQKVDLELLARLARADCLGRTGTFDCSAMDWFLSRARALGVEHRPPAPRPPGRAWAADVARRELHDAQRILRRKGLELDPHYRGHVGRREPGVGRAASNTHSQGRAPHWPVTYESSSADAMSMCVRVLDLDERPARAS